MVHKASEYHTRYSVWWIWLINYQLLQLWL